MTITLPEAVAEIARDKAARAGESVEDFLVGLILEKVQSASIRETLPTRETFEDLIRSGMDRSGDAVLDAESLAENRLVFRPVVS